MKLNKHRKEIVRALIRGINAIDDNPIAFGESEMEYKQHPQYDNCTATDLCFPDKMSEMLITVSAYGNLWMGLWLDCPLYLHDGDNEVSRKKGGDFHSDTLFPRWLAEVLNEECYLGIKEEDIYDTKD